jgi:hypothetical protein
MNSEHSTQIFSNVKKAGFKIGRMLTNEELKDIESAFNAKLPEDYKELLSKGGPTGKGFPDWKHPKKEAKKTWKWIDDAFSFDIQNSGYWQEEFGRRPNSNSKAVKQALKVIHTWPPLFPVYGHRFIPSSPESPGNPVISLYQAVDSIIYGANLNEYFSNEFGEATKSIVRHDSDIPNWGKALGL